ncbi:hypothetical protein J1N35_018677 [Gossypium stocksii]|uniref:Uncharacterized protein n=1 Tax=Gossypium stocksii TaxID=47602 RepID=A0A9D4A7B8_9ROSI|nr:hypothetical protein J1N35_018677 [Gossypium stocksii]
MDDTIKIITTAIFLTDFALLWWQSWSTNKRRREIESWKEFQHKLKGQFYLAYVEEESWESCDGLHNERCLKRFVLLRNDNPERGADRFGSSASDAKAKEAKENKKSVEYFLCGGPYRLRNCLKKSFIKRDNG